MSVLKFKQTTDTGASKVFKLDSKSAVKTFGSSRKADLVSIDPNAEKFVGAFEYRHDENQKWAKINNTSLSARSEFKPTSDKIFKTVFWGCGLT